LQNSVIRLQEDVTFKTRTAIVNSRLNTAFQVNGGDVVVIGAIVDGVNTVQDYTAQGFWEVPEALELYTGETYTTILTRDGRRYVNRTITKADYKGKSIAAIMGSDVATAQRLHPRLAFTEANMAGEFILHPNWQAAPGVNAGIKVAKESMDYVGMMREGVLLNEEASQDNALVSVKQPAVDQALTTRREGGINLDSKNLQLDVNGEEINIKFDPAMIEQFKKGDFTGVRPVIINITPIANMLPLLGMVRKEETEKLAKA
jgi:hypothetical protein